MDNFIRSLAAIQVVCEAILPAIKKTLTQWQQQLQTTLGYCASPHTCKSKGKPVTNRSCQSCVKWGQALEAAYYPQANIKSIQWPNINPTRLCIDFIEVAKGYVLRLQQGNIYTDLGKFDAASVLMLMIRFEPFHNGDATIPDKIHKVFNIRNDLSHMKVDSKMILDDLTTTRYFDEITDLVNAYHPHYFTQDDFHKLVVEIKKIHSSPVSERMREEALRPWVQQMQQRMEALELKSRREPPDFDVELCRRHLKQHYLQVLCKIPRRFPGDNQTIEMDRIYTNLSILRQVVEPLAPIQIPLNSHNEIFTTEANRMLPHRILILGRGGSGKSILIAKVAYDWARAAPDSSVKDIPLLFALNMRHIKINDTLEDAILHQLLPKDTVITKESLSHYIETNPSNVIVLLDSYDEFSRGVKLTNRKEDNLCMQNILSYNILTRCRVLVTSRHWRESDFLAVQNIYVKMEVTGFTAENIRNYIMKYYSSAEASGNRLYEYIESHNLFGVAAFPLMTQLFCIFWKHNEGKRIPTKIGELYTAIFQIIYKHCRPKGVLKHNFQLDEVMVHLGHVALYGLWPPENRLVFSLEEVKNIVSDPCMEDGCKIGIISIEDRGQISSFEQAMSQNSEEEESVVFFHKTGQEKCAGDYLADLASKDPGELKMKLHQLNTTEKCLSVQMILRFACGRNKAATGLILHKLIEVSKTIKDNLVAFYKDNLTDPLRVRYIQEFVELCLLCNYECGSNGQFNSMLLELFPLQMLQFYGVSPYTGMAVSNFLTWIQDKAAIHTIKIMPLPQLGAISTTNVASKIINNLYSEIQQNLSSKPLAEIQHLFTEYIDKNQNTLDLTEFNGMVGSDYSTGVSYIQLWEYFKHWQSSTVILNIGPILQAVQYISLHYLDLRNVNLHNQGDTLVAVMEQHHLSFLTLLNLADTHLDTQQLSVIVRILPQATPRLQALNIEYNKVDSVVIRQLAECLPALSIQELSITGILALAEDMNIFAERIPEFCLTLTVLQMNGNHMNDTAGMTLVKTLPRVKQLKVLSIGVGGISRSIHKAVLMAISKLTQLRVLFIYDSEHPEELIKYMAHVVQSLSELRKLFLVVPRNITMITASPQSVISRSTWKVFLSSLQTRSLPIVHLALYHIRLHKEDLQELVDWCMECDVEIQYTRNLWPKDMTIPSYNNLMLA